MIGGLGMLGGGMGGAGPIGGAATATTGPIKNENEIAADIRSGAGVSDAFGTFVNNAAFPGARLSATQGETNSPAGLGDSLKWLVPGFLALVGIFLVGRLLKKG